MLPRNRRQNGLLHQVAVLVLVDHDLFETTGELLRRIRRLSLLIHKNRESQMLHIVEIAEIPRSLFLGKTPGKGKGQLHQHLHGPARRLHIRKLRLGTLGKIVLFQGLNLVFHLIPEGFHLFFLVFVDRFILFRGKSRPFIHGLKGLVKLPVALRSLAFFQIFQVGKDGRLIEIGSSILLTDGKSLLQQFLEISDEFPGGIEPPLKPPGIFKFFHRPGGIDA